MKPAEIRTIKAKFDSQCPQCKTALKTGTEIGVTHDKVWRCLHCTRMFAELGPDKDSRGRRVYYLTEADALKDHARRAEIVARYRVQRRISK